MRVDLLHAGDLYLSVVAARECHGGEVRSTPGNLHEADARLLQRIVCEYDPPHDSVIEHVTYTWRISGISRACSHQLVRHRIASYSQRSQRYVNEDGFKFIVPDSIKRNAVAGTVYLRCMGVIQDAYDKLREAGIPRQDARFLLPNACETSLIESFNARSLRNFFMLRLDKKAQWEIRELARLMFESVPDEHKFMFVRFVGEQK